MSRIVVLSLAIFAIGRPTMPPPVPKHLESIKRGMTMDEVKQILGPPSRTARQILYRRHLEQWQYDEPNGWIEFQCAKGDKEFVLGVYPAK
jgi:hypothetical protein